MLGRWHVASLSRRRADVAPVSLRTGAGLAATIAPAVWAGGWCWGQHFSGIFARSSDTVGAIIRQHE
jgi:hypothetical protein